MPGLIKCKKERDASMNRLHGVLIIFIITVTISYFTPNISHNGITPLQSSRVSDQQLQINEGLSEHELATQDRRRETMKRLRTDHHLKMDHARKGAQ
jgi:cell division protein YceG involved in septum cleavage